jgi:ABC-type polysaccharide/polyol phosphate transport system ATPase subunit
MAVENVTSSFPAAARRRSAPSAEAPLAIQVEDLHKAFRIPTQRVDSLKERAVHPFAARDYRELRALDGISFDVRQGEFFGIVGRNGSGKSTLLKLLASIYRADSGTIRIAGRLAPFIELGVGFNLDLTARENTVLNGVMMGLTPQEARARLESVIAFAELDEFADLKLKNYSSGMLVRLAFSLMLEVDADVLLIDEVLAVGDASFQQKCADAFREMKAAGKTIILVTHEMGTVEEYCDRAMLISEGRIERLGDPGEVGRQYLRLNFEREGDAARAAVAAEAGQEGGAARMLDAWVENAAGERVRSFEHGEPINLALELDAREDFEGLDVGFILTNTAGVEVCQIATPVVADGTYRPIAKGQRLTVRATVENPLVPGHYLMQFGVNRSLEGGLALYVPRAVEFVVFGGQHGRGVVVLEGTIETEIEAAP